MRKVITMVVVTALGISVGSSRAYEAGEVQGGGTISGVVKLQGTAPPRAKLKADKDIEVCGKHELLASELVVGAGGGVENAVAYLANVAKGKKFDAAAPTLDQKGCEYTPHVVLVPAGTPLAVLNSDDILHNVHTLGSKNQAQNIAQPKFKKKLDLKLDQPEFVKLKCDVHGWMSGYVIVEDHPYYSVSGVDGAFRLTDVPPGDYELKLWHEKLGEKSQKVTVKEGDDAKVTFELSAK